MLQTWKATKRMFATESSFLVTIHDTHICYGIVPVIIGKHSFMIRTFATESCGVIDPVIRNKHMY